jgi:hypothetical protein
MDFIHHRGQAVQAEGPEQMGKSTQVETAEYRGQSIQVQPLHEGKAIQSESPQQQHQGTQSEPKVPLASTKSASIPPETHSKAVGVGQNLAKKSVDAEAEEGRKPTTTAAGTEMEQQRRLTRTVSTEQMAPKWTTSESQTRRASVGEHGTMTMMEEEAPKPKRTEWSGGVEAEEEEEEEEEDARMTQSMMTEMSDISEHFLVPEKGKQPKWGQKQLGRGGKDESVTRRERNGIN